MKLILFRLLIPLPCRAPQGARGLKYTNGSASRTAMTSRPARGAWIEMVLVLVLVLVLVVAPRKGRVD